MITTVLTLVSIALCTLAMVVAWIFCYVYSHEPWRNYEAGRHLMYFTLGLAIILTWSVAGLVLRLILGSPEWLMFILSVGRVAIFGWCLIMLYNRLRLLRDGIRARAAAFARDLKEGTDHNADRQAR